VSDSIKETPPSQGKTVSAKRDSARYILVATGPHGVAKSLFGTRGRLLRQRRSSPRTRSFSQHVVANIPLEELMKSNWKTLLLITVLLFAVTVSPSEGARRFPVTFEFSPPISARTVTLAGNFNNWNKNAQPMQFEDA